MRKLHRGLLSAILVSSSVSAVCAQQTDTVSATVASDGKTVVYHSVFVTPDCKMASLPRLKILKNAEYGKIEFVRAQIHPNFASDNARSKCNEKKIEGVDVYYTPKKGFEGSDTFVIRESTSSEANVWDTTFNIKVLN